MLAHASGLELDTHHAGGQVGEARVTNGTPLLIIFYVQAASFIVTLSQPRPVR
jgi:hypothetical protein